jgi:hypothetical protein
MRLVKTNTAMVVSTEITKIGISLIRIRTGILRTLRGVSFCFVCRSFSEGRVVGLWSLVFGRWVLGLFNG